MKKIKVLGLLAIGGVAMAFSSCRYDKADELYVTPICDTTAEVTFSGFVEPLMQQKCYNCHAQSNYNSLGGGILLEGYVNLIDYVNIGSFMSSIKHESSNPMPKNEAKLDDCTIAKLDKWIAAGALEN